MAGEPCAKRGEPPWGGGVSRQRKLQRKEHRGAAHVPAIEQHLMGLGQFVLRQPDVNGRQHITATGMADDMVPGLVKFLMQGMNGLRGHFRHSTMQLVAEFSLAIHEADLLPVLRQVQGAEVGKMQITPAHILALQHKGCRAVTEKTEADKNAGIITHVER